MADQTQPFNITQDIFLERHPTVRVYPYQEVQLTQKIVSDFALTAVDGIIGVAPAYGAKCALVALALATSTTVLTVRFPQTKGTPSRKNKPNSGRALVGDSILCHADYKKFAFKADKVAASLYLDLGQRITDAVDLFSVSTADRQSLDAIMAALGGETTLNKPSTIQLFKHEESDKAPTATIAMQAWAAWRAATLPSLAKRLARIPRINTQVMAENALTFLAKTIRDAERLDALKPTRVRNDVSGDFSHKGGNLNLSCTRYKTRIMRMTARQTLEIETVKNGKRDMVKGRPITVQGRAATIGVQGTFNGSKIKSVTTNGKEGNTTAEALRAHVVLDAMKGTQSILAHAFVRKIWLPTESVLWPTSRVPRRLMPLQFKNRPLNGSQKLAVNAILSISEEHRITVIHGPPGTGKTTVIAAAVRSTMAVHSDQTLWLVAQSNVAVKNIAEKLADVDFVDFKLLVSKDFHFDWHEHLYGKIVHNVIRSDDFPEDRVSAERLLLGSRVILCTLSMLSNHRIRHIALCVPVQTVIVDEASQIEVGDYVPLLSTYKPTLQKLVFIGDNRQHRMPIHIGAFISKHVYDKRLQSVHKITSALACRLVDVSKGRESSAGHSWVVS
ncbi:hypothetical protein PLICRDRAFT_116758 [Plicaturopsis crispa FD-325 SS-3]|uniref:DNA2/NAM7 helicase helicase domain-containing protein n=1 Tax=Plicaturopsis crispa FD-325 SS-3 TaxID=944288 RepID=A0A0C9T9T8_PLICR|nr:hypothetical protein PLICRDRAFT_116758 [Plicaturopsis crispa FD-325 SS-3]